MRRSARLLPLLLLLLPAPTLAGGKNFEGQYRNWRPDAPLLRNLPDGTLVQTRITRVEIYPGGALIERSAEVELPPGESRLVVPALPDAIQATSLQIAGFGKEAVAGSTFLEAGTLVEARPKELVELEQALSQLEGEDRQLAAREAALHQRKDLLAGIVAKLSVSGPGVAEVVRALDLVQQESLRIDAELAKLDADRQKLTPRLEAVRQDHDELKKRLQRPVKHVVVEVTAQSKVKLPLLLRYFLHGPTWKPRHVARFDPQGGQLTLETYAWLVQDTGEDWQDVPLTVATARPGGGLHAPVAGPMEVHADKQDEGVVAGEARRLREDPDTASGLAAGGLRLFQAGKVSLPSGERGRRVLLETTQAAAETTRLAVPRLEPGVYLRLQWKNPRITPLLAGEAALLHGADYVGTATLPVVQPGEVLTLPFGRDPLVTVTRTRTAREVVEAGRGQTIRHVYAFSARNDLGKPVAVEVRDQLPVAKDRAVKVSHDGGSLPAAPGGKDQAAGTLVWKLEVPAGQQTAWDLRWSVSVPAGQRVLGAD